MEPKKAEDILKMVISKAWEDKSFRKQLTADPIGTIENHTGAKVILPEGKELIIIDQTDTTKVFVNIPSEPDFENVELSEEQLEKIAGGGGGDEFWSGLSKAFYPTLKNYLKP